MDVAGVVGTGVDIQHIGRLEEAINKQGDRFLIKIFTRHEIEYCEKRGLSAQHYAARWAIKEAVYKALGGAMKQPYRFVDVETRNAPGGKPCLHLYGAIRAFADARRLSFQISLSHSEEYAVGFVVALRQQGREGVRDVEKTIARPSQPGSGDGVLP